MRGSSCRFSHDPGDQLCEVITDVTPTNQYAWTIQGAPRDSWIIQRAPRTIQRAQPLATNPPPQQQHPQIHPRAVTNPQQHQRRQARTKSQSTKRKNVDVEKERKADQEKQRAIMAEKIGAQPRKKRMIVPMLLSSETTVANNPTPSIAATPESISLEGKHRLLECCKVVIISNSLNESFNKPPPSKFLLRSTGLE